MTRTLTDLALSRERGWPKTAANRKPQTANCKPTSARAHHTTTMTRRWVDATDGADLRNRVARGEIRLDQLDPETLFNIAVTYYPETIPQGPHARNTVIQRFCRILLRIRSELEQQGARRRAAVGGNDSHHRILFFLLDFFPLSLNLESSHHSSFL